MGGYSSEYRKSRRRSHMGRFRRRRFISGVVGPWILLGCIVLLVVGAVLAGIFFIVPWIRGDEALAPTPTVMGAYPTPTPSDDPLSALQNLGVLQQEIVSDNQYVSDPFYYDGMVYFSAGKAELGSPQMHTVYEYDTLATTPAETKMEQIVLANSDLFQFQRNDRYFVWLDQKSIGGGNIMAMDGTGQPFIAKTYYAGLPKVTLQGRYLFWVERTGTRMDKLFGFDLVTRENVTLDLFENSPYGMSTVSVCAKEIAWADESPQSTSSVPKSVIYTLKLDGLGGQADVYSPDMYVHDPLTNGEVLVWQNTNHDEENALFISRNRGEPELVEENVLHYALGSDFLVYSKDQRVYIYFWAQNHRQAITLDTERAMLINVHNDCVFWFKLGEYRDIVKYALIGG